VQSTYLLTLPGTFFFYPCNCPDLAPSDIHLFTHLKQFLGSDEEVQMMVKDWFSGLAADFYDVGMQKLIT
jgi:hypothetical protein